MIVLQNCYDIMLLVMVTQLLFMIIIVHLDIGVSKYSLFYHYFEYLIDDKDLINRTHYYCAIMGKTF